MGIFTLLSVSLAISAQPVHPTTGEPLMIDCLRGTPDAIDGDLSDWNLEAMTPAVLDVAEQLHSGQDSWAGPEDCSGEFYLLWDDENIYMAVVVKDDALSMNKSDGNIWNADAVEVFFATTNAIAGHDEHYQYGFNANNQRWNWCNIDGAGSIEPDYLQIASSVTADGYVCEASIPYGQMPSLDFSAGNIIGFHPVFDDTDNGDRELQMTWTGLEAHDQSLGFGHMVLSADPVPAPEGWQSQDIGTTGGSADESDGTWTISADGADVWGSSDEFHYAYMPLSGDGTIIAHVVDNGTGSNSWAKGGVMIRETLDADSKHMIMALTGGDGGGIAFQGRPVTGERSNSFHGDVTAAPPYWVKLARVGNTITGYSSADGVDWELFPDASPDGAQTNPIDVEMAADVYIGLFVTSHASGELRTYLFDNVSIELPIIAPEPVNPGTDGLVASYALDGDANDGSGNGIDGTINNADTGGLGDGGSVWVDDPERGTVISFNGTADGAFVRAGEIPQMTLTNDFTWSFWAKHSDENTADNDIILGNRMDENAVDFVPRQFIKFTPTKFEWHMNGNGDDNMEYDDIPADVWLHHAVVKTADQLTYYRNGVEGGSGVITQPLDFPQPLFFGGDNEGSAGENWSGLMSDVCIYNRALSAGEVMFLADQRATPVDPGTDGLAAFYPLENDVLDASGNGNDGTIVGAPTVVDGPAGYGMALEFHGLGAAGGGGDYIDCGNDASLDIAGPISLALWIRPGADDPEGQGTETAPMAKAMSGVGWSWQVRYGWGSPQPYMAFTFNTSPRAWAYVGRNLEKDEWTHIACSHDGATLKCYLDGEETDSTPMGQITSSEAPILIGSDGWGCDWIGAIDEVAIYSRALSDGEIRYLAGISDEVENLLLNPSFEEDEPVLDDPDWVQWCTWNPAEGAGSNATIVDTDAVDGAKSLRIEPVGDTNWYFIVLQGDIPVDVDKNYTTNFWAKAEAPRSLTLQMKASDNSISAWGATDFELTTDWAEYSYTSEVLIDIVKLEILCAGSEVPFLLDLVSVTEAQ
jgi:hypothetical protein